MNINISSSKILRQNSKKWEFTPAHLTHSQREDPIAAIDPICGWFTLFDARDRLKDLFQAAMASSFWENDEPEEKEDKMFFFDQLMQLVESAYFLNQMVIEDRLTYTLTPKK
jgi:hypothetical protein